MAGFAATAGRPPPPPPPPPAGCPPVVVDASAVVVVEGSSTMVGPGSAVVVLDDFPTTSPFSVREPAEQAPVRMARAARPATPVLRTVDWVCMGKWSTFPERVERAR